MDTADRYSRIIENDIQRVNQYVQLDEKQQEHLAKELAQVYALKTEYYKHYKQNPPRLKKQFNALLHKLP